jgi:endonuclease YncB( thermonuclease family)
MDFEQDEIKIRKCGVDALESGHAVKVQQYYISVGKDSNKMIRQEIIWENKEYIGQEATGQLTIELPQDLR